MKKNQKKKKDQKVSPILKAVTKLSKEFARLIAKDNKLIYELEWRQLEQLIATVFDEFGFDVTLTRPSKDGGKDIILEYWTENKKFVYYVEIKHWISGNKVGKKDVLDFVEIIVKEKIDGGLFLSTSGYGKNVIDIVSEIERNKIKLDSKDKIYYLCRTFVKSESGFWRAPNDLRDLIFV